MFQTQVSERTLCGALMIEIHEELKRTKFSDYFVDVEYNRNIGGKLKTLKKTIKGLEYRGRDGNRNSWYNEWPR